MAGGSRGCDGVNAGGSPCGATAMRESRYCFFHSPDTQQEASDARRLGGQRRKREGAVAGAYDLDDLATASQIRRLIEIAVFDTLALENSVSRNRTLAYLSQTALKMLEVGEYEDRLAALESTIQRRTG